MLLEADFIFSFVQLILRFSLPSLDLTGGNLAMADVVPNGTADQFLLNISLLAVLTQLLLSAPAEIDAYSPFTKIQFINSYLILPYYYSTGYTVSLILY